MNELYSVFNRLTPSPILKRLMHFESCNRNNFLTLDIKKFYPGAHRICLRILGNESIRNCLKYLHLTIRIFIMGSLARWAKSYRASIISTFCIRLPCSWPIFYTESRCHLGTLHLHKNKGMFLWGRCSLKLRKTSVCVASL